jgi:hypothetical protein
MASDDDPTPRDGTELVTRDRDAASNGPVSCAARLAGSDRYCESDGYDFEQISLDRCRRRRSGVLRTGRNRGDRFPRCVPSAQLSARRGRVTSAGAV